MLTKEAKEELEKQQYRVIGSHSAVKICGWTKSALRGKGSCYKQKFYGINSSQCMQMTTSISCANRCKICWRDYKAPVSKEWKWSVDEPTMILEGCLKAQFDLLAGFKGFEKVDLKEYEKSNTVKHAALSLTGDSIIYPKLNEFIDELHKRGISTFLVTNAQFPEQLKNMKPITQLYVSVDAPNKELLKEIDVPLFEDFWERFNKSLEYLSQKKQRTALRLTIVKGINDKDLEGYASIIHKGNPDLVEVKGYMWLGASRERLKIENMPLHEDIVKFTNELAKYLPEYEIVTDHVPSRVVLLAKKKFKKNGKWHTWIDFNKFNKLALSGKEFTAEDYIKSSEF